MAQVLNVVMGLATALIGYVVGRVWRTYGLRRRFRRARRFWQPVVDGHFQIVTSRFEVDGFREPTGIVGGGDAIANRLLGDLFQDIGLERPRSVYVDEPELDRDRNLIVLGGPNANRVADEALARVKPGLHVVDPGPGLCMQVEDRHEVAAGVVDEARQRVFIADPSDGSMTDYGVIIRARSPFNPDRALVVISGAYGYGTWAGAQLSRTPEFLRRCEELDEANNDGGRQGWSLGTWLGLRTAAVPNWAEIECLFRVDVIDRRPQRSEILVFRQISGAQPSGRLIRSSERDGSFFNG